VFAGVFDALFKSAQWGSLHLESLALNLLVDEGIIGTGTGCRPIETKPDGEDSHEEDQDSESDVVPGERRSQPLARCHGVGAHCGTPLDG
jgi:hypothetical protein